MGTMIGASHRSTRCVRKFSAYLTLSEDKKKAEVDAKSPLAQRGFVHVQLVNQPLVRLAGTPPDANAPPTAGSGPRGGARESLPLVVCAGFAMHAGDLLTCVERGIDVILAVMERGVAIVVSYLQHQMTKEHTPAGQVRRWIEGALAQVADPHLISMSRAAAGQISATANWRAADDEIMSPMRDLLTEPVAALGSADARRDADTVFRCTAAAMRHHLDSADRPGPADVDHLVRFCLRGLGAG